MKNTIKLFTLLLFIGLGNMCFTLSVESNDPPGVLSCQNCHLNENMVNAVNIVNVVAHDPKNTNHKSELTSFINNNTTGSAAALNVDLQRLSAYVANL